MTRDFFSVTGNSLEFLMLPFVMANRAISMALKATGAPLIYFAQLEDTLIVVTK